MACAPPRFECPCLRRSGDLNALTQLLARDVRVVTDGGGKVAAALDVIDGADRVMRS